MNDFIEKLIGRLEEKAIEHRETGFEMERKGFSNIADKQYAKQTTYLNSIEIVNQLAEEYNNGWIEKLLEAKKNCGEDSDCSECPFGQIEDRCILAELQTNADNNGWIPVSDKLPEKSGKYLVTISEGGSVHTTVRRFNPKPKHPQQNEPIFTKYLPFYSGWERATRGVVAWKELPEPFKPKGE